MTAAPLLAAAPTEAEAREDANLAARTAYEQQAHARLIPAATDSEGFAGAYFDHDDNGRLVITTTRGPAELRRELAPLSIPGGPAARVVQVDHDLETLEEAKGRLISRLDALDGDLSELSNTGVSIDVTGNQLVVGIDPDELHLPRPLPDELTDLPTGVTTEYRDRGRGTETCTRSDCTDPLQAGTLISADGANCTMGFHVTRAGSAHILTSGHCRPEGTDTWTHANITLGTRTATLYGEGGIDAQIVPIPDAQASNEIFGVSRTVRSARNPIAGETICASLATSATVDCGTVTDASDSWIGERCQCRIFGANTSLSAVLGDSGSPAYAPIDPGGEAVAIGVVALSTGEIARVGDSLDGLNATIRTS